MDTFLQLLVNALTLGSIYALIALGYTMVYGILQLINFAHGEIYMIGSYVGVIVITAFAGSAAGPWVVLPLAFLAAMTASALVGVTVERVAYRPLRNAPRLAPLISALGASFFLANFVFLAQGAEDKTVPAGLVTSVYSVGPLTVSLKQIIIVVSAFLLMGSLQVLVRFTRMGRAMRATAQDRTAARLMGVNVDRIIFATFLIGSALAAAAGVMVALFYGKVHYTDGLMYGLKAFTAAVVGGIGNIPGAMAGGLLIGFVEKFAEGYMEAQWKDVWAFVVLIGVLMFRPTGLFGKGQVEKV